MGLGGQPELERLAETVTYRGLRVPDNIAVQWDTSVGRAYRVGVDQAINTTTMEEVWEQAEPTFPIARKGRKAP